MQGYWQRYAAARASRRRLLAGATALGVGGVALAVTGCGGGGDDGGDGGSEAQGKVQIPQDTTSQAKPGGVLKSAYISANPASLDPHTSQGFTTLTAVAVYVYPRLLTFKPAKYPDFTDGAVEGDLAESFEVSGDKLQITLKLRQGLKWDSRSPTNGREIDAEDVVWNWNKFSKVGVRRSDLMYDPAAPGAPVVSMQAPDKRTIIVKLNEPDASALQLLASARIFFVVPREAEDKFDSRNEVRGYGPFTLAEYTPSALFRWRKIPDYYRKGRPFIDEIEQPHVTEYAQRLAQFKAGNIWTPIATAQDVLSVIKETPQLAVQQEADLNPTPTHISWGYEGDSPFKDVRVRQAVALAVDRETIADVTYDRQKFVAEGFEPVTKYQTLLGAGWGDYWLDPQHKDFGPNARWWTEFNISEAKKLLSAAGFAGGIKTNIYWTPRQYGAAYEREVDILIGMLKEVGIEAQSSPKEYQTEYIPDIYYSYTGPQGVKGFNGLIYRAELAYPTAVAQLFGNYHPSGGRYRGVRPDGGTAKQGDPKLNQMIEAARKEFDTEKQIDMVHDILRYAAGQVYSIPPRPANLGIVACWPVIGNHGLYRTQTGGSPTNESYVPYWWIDTTKPPLSRPA
jgi:peptide/nickel transport system substrate-binding protein